MSSCDIITSNCTLLCLTVTLFDIIMTLFDIICKLIMWLCVYIIINNNFNPSLNNTSNFIIIISELITAYIWLHVLNYIGIQLSYKISIKSLLNNIKNDK